MREIGRVISAIFALQLALQASDAVAVPILLSENPLVGQDGVTLQIRNYKWTAPHSIFVCELGAATCDKTSNFFSDILVLDNVDNVAEIIFRSDSAVPSVPGGNEGLINGTPMDAADPSFVTESNDNPVISMTFDATDNKGNKGTLTIKFSSDPDPSPRPRDLSSDTIEIVAGQEPAPDVAVAPEPNAALLVAMGLVGLAWWRKYPPRRSRRLLPAPYPTRA